MERQTQLLLLLLLHGKYSGYIYQNFREIVADGAAQWYTYLGRLKNPRPLLQGDQMELMKNGQKALENANLLNKMAQHGHL